MKSHNNDEVFPRWVFFIFSDDVVGPRISRRAVANEDDMKTLPDQLKKEYGEKFMRMVEKDEKFEFKFSK